MTTVLYVFHNNQARHPAAAWPIENTEILETIISIRIDFVGCCHAYIVLAILSEALLAGPEPEPDPNLVNMVGINETFLDM